MDTFYEKQMRAKDLKKRLKAKHVFVDYRYENRMIPLFSEPQRELVEYIMNTDGCMVDDLIKEICTKENKNVDFESLKSTYYGRQEQ